METATKFFGFVLLLIRALGALVVAVDGILLVFLAKDIPWQLRLLMTSGFCLVVGSTCFFDKK